MNMSIVACFLLFFLCISLNDNACGARLLGEEKKFHLPNKNLGEEKMIHPDKISATANDQKASSSTDQLHKVAMANESKIEESAIHEATKKIKNTGPVSDSAVQRESAGSFSWTIPHTKNNDKHPGFNSDYSPPKTHPPSHN